MAEADPGPLAGLAAVPEITVADAADLDARLRTAWPDTLYRTVVRFTGQLQLTVR